LKFVVTEPGSGHDRLAAQPPRYRSRAVTTSTRIVVPPPKATLCLFTDVTSTMNNIGINFVGEFASGAFNNAGVLVCTYRHKTNKYVRFAYSGINGDGITEGLDKLKSWIEAV
jgi:hypothetical protein